MPSRTGRISEDDLLLPMLIELANSPDDWLSTSQLIEKLTLAMKPADEEAETLEDRTGAGIAEVVGSMISHQDSPGKIIREGYAEHVNDGFKITEAGHKYLQRKGY